MRELINYLFIGFQTLGVQVGTPHLGTPRLGTPFQEPFLSVEFSALASETFPLRVRPWGVMALWSMWGPFLKGPGVTSGTTPEPPPPPCHVTGVPKYSKILSNFSNLQPSMTRYLTNAKLAALNGPSPWPWNILARFFWMAFTCRRADHSQLSSRNQVCLFEVCGVSLAGRLANAPAPARAFTWGQWAIQYHMYSI